MFTTLTRVNLEPLRPWGPTVLRVVVGTVFLAHGWQKLTEYTLLGVAKGFGALGIPFPYLSAVLATGMELIGGGLLIAGLFTRFASLGLAFTMGVALVTAHLSNGFFAATNGYEYVLTLLAANLALALTGPGALALDNLVWRRREQRDIGFTPVTAGVAAR